MKTCFKSCAVTLLAVTSVIGVHATQTNIVQNLTFKLTAWSQGSTTTNGTLVKVTANKQSIVTKDIIGWLGTATTNSFTNAQLLVINPLGAPATKSLIIVRQTTRLSPNHVVTKNVDVSDFFGMVTFAATVNNYSYNKSNNVVNPGTYYGYWGFYLLGDTNHPALPVTFQVTGLGVDSAVNIVNAKKKNVGLADQFSIANAAGYGDVNGQPFILGGNILIGGKTLEVTP